jgi:hypothetical protein
MSKIVASIWWTPGPPAGPLIGAVLLHDETTGEMKPYIGTASGLDEEMDARLIAEWGAKVAPAIGRAMFPAYSDRRWAGDA